MAGQYNPYQQQPNMPQQNIPTQKPIQETNLIIYIITIIISSLVLLLLNGSLVLSINFLPLTSFTVVYVFISIISLVIGLITGFILNKIAKTNRLLLSGNLIISILSAVIISIYLFMQKRVAEQIADLGTSLAGMFGPTPNPMLVGVLMIVFFNVVPLILFFKRKKASP